ncbi:hypothetical protein D3C73_916020 [compost metagenome]
MLHGRDRGGDVFRRVIGDGVLHAGREVGLDGVQLGDDRLGGRQGVGARLLDDGDADAALAVEVAFDAVDFRAEFDAGDVADTGHAALGVGLEHDLAELFRGRQAALDLNRQLEGGGVGREGGLADRTAGGLDVLGLQGGDDLRRGQVACGRLGRVDPDPHGVVAAAEDLDAADAVDPQQAVADRRLGHVAQVVAVDAGVVGRQRRQHQEAGRLLVDDDADLTDLRRKARLGQGDAVLDQHLGGVEVGAGLEGHGDLDPAVGGRRRGHVEHVLDAVDLLLQRRGDRLGQGFSRGAGVGGGHADRRRRDIRILRQRQHRHGEGADQGDEDRDHDREDRSVDEEAGYVHGSGSGP